MTWEPGADGIVELPGGGLVRGRGLRRPEPPGPAPEFAVYLLGRPPAPVPWTSRWVRWPDFRLPTDRDDLFAALREVLRRAPGQRVELVCAGGRGRTGTALACLVVLDGWPAADAVAWVRRNYHPKAVETRAQRGLPLVVGNGCR